MPVVSTRWLLALVGVAAYAAVALLFGGDAQAQREKPVAAAAKQDDKGGWLKRVPTRLYYSKANCEQCHKGKPPEKWLKGKDLLCRCNEAVLWVENDKHADAYLALTGERGKQMAKILGYDVTKDARCLSCHAVVIEDKALRERSEAGGWDVKEGVNCVACHGAYRDWIGAHGLPGDAIDFRPLTREEKEKHGGMADLWNPIKRAELCASCHIGSLNHDPKKGIYRKFVTHEMYAAGHPPLPGFEAAMFSEEMPRHWEYLREKKSKSVREELGFKEGEKEQSRLLLVGAAVALRESMNLLVQQARDCQKATDDDDKVMDLVNFDCYACHHDLKSNSWRQKRGYVGKPGRVPMRTWPTELVKLGIAQSAGKDAAKEIKAFEAARKKLELAFSARPYGDPKKIEEEARALAKWAGGLADKLNKPVYAKDVTALLGHIPKFYIKSDSDKASLDYDSARQVGWAFDVMYNELYGDPYKRKGIAETKDIGDKAVRKAQLALSDYLKLRLPIGRKAYDKKGKSIEDELQKALEKLNAYEPAKFQELLGDLTKALK